MASRAISRAAIGVMCGGAALSLPAQSRPPADGGMTASLGQPWGWQWSLGVATGVRSRSGDGAAIAEGRVGVYRELMNRALGVGGVQFEAYTGSFATGRCCASTSSPGVTTTSPSASRSRCSATSRWAPRALSPTTSRSPRAATVRSPLPPSRRAKRP